MRAILDIIDINSNDKPVLPDLHLIYMLYVNVVRDPLPVWTHQSILQSRPDCTFRRTTTISSAFQWSAPAEKCEGVVGTQTLPAPSQDSCVASEARQGLSCQEVRVGAGRERSGGREGGRRLGEGRRERRRSFGKLHYRLANHLRREKAAIQVQRHIRGYLQRGRYSRLRLAAVAVQCFARRRAARKVCTIQALPLHFIFPSHPSPQAYVHMLRNSKASCIQCHVRGWLVRCRYRRTLRHVIKAQCCVRRWLAKRQLGRLKVRRVHLQVS